MDEAWRALSHATRRDILQLVREQERTAGDIAAAFSITRPAVSQHLSLLRASGLLQERREGTRRLYSLCPGALRALRDYLVELAPLPAGAVTGPAARPSPSAFEAHLESRPAAAFQLFADPAQLARWKGPLHGSFSRLESPSELRMDFGWRESTRGSASATISFAPAGTGTHVRVLHEGPEAEGWQRYLPRLEALARGWDPGPEPEDSLR